MNRRLFSAILSLVAIGLWAPLTATATTIDTVPVGNPGNPQSSSGGGAVSYEYRLGTYEVTNDQYVEFLNAKAASDPLNLFNPAMNSIRGGIARSGSPGSYSYAVRPNMGNKPANYVTWYEAVRFCNWLHNGQGNGDTESGAYTLLGGTAVPSNGSSVARDPDAIWFLPTVSEWKKGGFYDPRPFAQGGPPGGYWVYATKSSSTPTLAIADSVGNITNPATNVVNYDSGADWNGQDGNVTTVGGAGLLSASFYGTFDQSGNVWEWIDSPQSGNTRLALGGGWDVAATFLNGGAFSEPAGGFANIGFRVASIPEPSTLVLAALGAAALARRRKR